MQETFRVPHNLYPPNQDNAAVDENRHAARMTCLTVGEARATPKQASGVQKRSP